jgi:hypothetical protein
MTKGIATTLTDREIFAVGTWSGSRKVVADTAFLDQIVASYENLNSKVNGFAIPIKLGHNKKVGEPAYGYATNVRREGSTLIADFTDMAPEIVDAIQQKRYNAVSVELWPEIEYAGVKFSQVLSGVALLGAEWPAVKGLQPLYASEFTGDGALTLSKEEVEMPNFTQEQHEVLLAAAVAAAVSDAGTSFTAQVAELSAQVTAAAARADTAEAALALFAEEAEKKDIAAIIEAAEKAGKIVPANKASVVAFAETLRKSIAKPEDRKVAMASFKSFVEALPKKVDFTEEARSEGERPGGEAMTAGQEVVNRVAKLRQADKGLSFKDAMAQVFAADDDLKNRYAEENR